IAAVCGRLRLARSRRDGRSSRQHSMPELNCLGETGGAPRELGPCLAKRAKGGFATLTAAVVLGRFRTKNGVDRETPGGYKPRQQMNRPTPGAGGRVAERELRHARHQELRDHTALRTTGAADRHLAGTAGAGLLSACEPRALPGEVAEMMIKAW